MRVNEDQIEQLYVFTRKHYVEWYDLQTELVDHLANGIETQWEQHPTLDFEKALEIEFKKFGVFGFMDVVEHRQGTLTKKYGKLIWQHVKAYFKLPKIILLLLLTTATYFLLATEYIDKEVLAGVWLSFYALYFVGLVIRKRKFNKKKTPGAKKWLLEEIIINHGAAMGFTLIPLYVTQIFITPGYDLTGLPEPVLALISLIFVLNLIMMYVMIFEIPARAEDYLKETYPEYQLAS